MKFKTGPFENLSGRPWPLKDIAFSICIPLLLLIFTHISYSVNIIRFRPWIAGPLFLFVWILLYIFFLLYPVLICKRRGFWPLFQSVSASKISKEIIISFLLVILLNVIVGLVGKLLSMSFETAINTPKAWRWSVYGYHSFLQIFVVIIGFSLGPVAEEVFFRGFFYNALKTRLPIFIAVIIQALAFSAFHCYAIMHTFIVFLIGIVLSIAYEKRRSLLSPIFIHIIMNAIFLIPTLAITFQNIHNVASTWDEAKRKPVWLETKLSGKIQRQKDGIEQWKYAIDKWGSRGSRQWKKEMSAFNTVCIWFPNDRKACAKAKLGMVAIYYQYFRDYRRAVVEANNLLMTYPDQREECASALAKKGWSYYMLKDFKKSKRAFNWVIDNFSDCKKALESSKKGIKWIKTL